TPCVAWPDPVRAGHVLMDGVMESDDARELEGLAQSVVERARRAGADVAEASARQGFDLSVRVRLGNPERVEEAGHRGVSLRVLRDQRVAITSTSDLSPAGLERLVNDAIELLDLSQPDPCAGPAAPELLAKPPFPDYDLYDPRVARVDADEALRIATLAERAALAFDPRIKLSEGATFARSSGVGVL